MYIMKYLSSGSIFLISLLILILFLSSILPRFLIDLEGFRGMSTPYSTYIGNQPIDSRVSNLIDPNQEKTCKKIFGFDGLYCNPDSQKGGIDVFYGLSSNALCAGSGLVKEHGNICLDAPSYALLTTRGGNATGANSTSGTKDSIIG
jgi:hypothetical protein